MSKAYFFFSMNRNIAGVCHLTFVAYLFLSPLTYWRGTGFQFEHYLMTCMTPLFQMIIFYLNYIILAPKLFVSGKHRYDLLINVFLLITLGAVLHFWMVYVNSIYGATLRGATDSIGTISYIARNSLNLAIFAAGGTALAVARRWVTTDQKLKAAEAARAKAELSNMRNQINPHFLLNTLNNIYALIQFDQTKAQDAVISLSRMLNHMLYQNKETYTTLEREVEFLANYVDLMRLRVSENVKIEFDTDITNAGQMPIAPMLFISLVENAFKHGIGADGGHINIHIDANPEEGIVRAYIHNSNHPKNDQDMSGHGVGLAVTQRRLELLYSGNFTWEKGVDEEKNEYYSNLTIHTT